LNGQATMTLENLAKELGVTRERVRQIQMDALNSLRTLFTRLGMSGEYVQ
jgi:RNA polymerase nonessential primary-like sigma factor